MNFLLLLSSHQSFYRILFESNNSTLIESSSDDHQLLDTTFEVELRDSKSSNLLFSRFVRHQVSRR